MSTKSSGASFTGSGTPSQASLGHLLQHHRKAQGLTLTDLAAQAGIHKSTLSRWERGKTVPFAQELTHVLQALQLSLPERQAYYRALEAPRAIQVAIAGATSALPVASGELLQALRRRAGVPRSVVAQAANVSQSLVVRWEKGECWPSAQHLHAFCLVIGATEDEIVFLSTRAWRYLDPLPLDKEALDDVVLRLEHHDTSTTRAGTYLALAARYHALFQAGKISEVEATSVYGSYGYYLGWRLGKFKEAGRVAAPVYTGLMRSRGLLTYGQREAITLQIEYGDKFHSAYPLPNPAGEAAARAAADDFARNQALLEGITNRLPPARHAWHNDLTGTAWKKVGNLDEASRYFERSIALAGTPEEEALRRSRFATMLRRQGRFRQAVSLLLPPPAGEKRVVVRAGTLLNHAQIFVGLGDYAQAERYLSEAVACLHQQGLDRYEAEANTIALSIESGRRQRPRQQVLPVDSAKAAAASAPSKAPR